MNLVRIIFGVIFLFTVYGCRTKEIYVPIESVKTEYQDRVVRDSTYLRDSVFLKIKGDTVYLEKYKTLYKNTYLRDSIFVQDTICVPYPVDKIIEVNQLHWYQKLLAWIGLGGVVICLFWLIKRIKN